MTLGSKLNVPVLRFRATDPGRGSIELELRDVKPPRDSLEIRVFLNQPDASAATPTEGNPRYAGSLYLFGRGDLGSQAGGDAAAGPTLPDPMAPMSLRLDVSDAVAALSSSTSDFEVTLVAVDPKGRPIDAPDTDFASISVVVSA